MQLSCSSLIYWSNLQPKYFKHGHSVKIHNLHRFYNSQSFWGGVAKTDCQHPIGPTSWVIHSTTEHFPIRIIGKYIIHYHITIVSAVAAIHIRHQMLTRALLQERNTIHGPNDIIYYWFAKTSDFSKLLFLGEGNLTDNRLIMWLLVNEFKHKVKNPEQADGLTSKRNTGA